MHYQEVLVAVKDFGEKAPTAALTTGEAKAGAGAEAKEEVPRMIDALIC